MKKLILLIGFLAVTITAFSQTVRTRTYFHDLFITGYKPTQTNYRDLWASIFYPAIDTLNLTQLVGVDGTLSTDATLSTASNRQLSSTLALKTYIDNAVSGGGTVTSVFGRTGAVTANAGDYTASQVTNVPAAGIAATDVQASITELANEKADTSRAAGGDVSGTLSSMQIRSGVVGPTELASTAVTLGTYGNATNVPQFTVDADGRITAASNVAITFLPANGDYGDIDVTSSGSVWTVDTSAISTIKIAADAITTAKILDGTITNSDLSSGVGGIYKTDGTSPSDIDVTMTDSIQFGSTLKIDDVNKKVTIGSNKTPVATLNILNASSQSGVTWGSSSSAIDIIYDRNGTRDSTFQIKKDGTLSTYGSAANNIRTKDADIIGFSRLDGSGNNSLGAHVINSGVGLTHEFQAPECCGGRINWFLAHQKDNAKFYVAFEKTPYDGFNNTGDTIVMTIDTLKNVGIGTQSPGNRLHVKGGIQLDTLSTIAANNGTIRYTGTDFEGRIGGSWTSLTTAAGGGTVSSVGLSMPAIFSVSGTPVTTSGTLTASLASQTQNLVFASPNGSSGAPTFRAIVAADLPSASILPSGTTGQTLRHNGTSWIANSNLLNDGTNVGIGGTPSYPLHVTGQSYFTTNMGIGATPSTGVAARVSGTWSPDGSGFVYGLYQDVKSSTSATRLYGTYNRISSSASGSTLAVFANNFVAAPSYGAGTSVTNAYGIDVENQGNALATTSYGIRIQNQSGSGTTWGLAVNGGSQTSKSYLMDNVYFGNNTSATAKVHIAAGTTSASSAPLKFTSGSLMTTAEAGAVEFLTDKFYGTITTGAARKEFTLNDAALTSGTIPTATTNGRLTDSGLLTGATSAALSVPSTTKGFLPPVMTITQRNAISTPATGLFVYQTTTNKPSWYNGSAWRVPLDSTTAESTYWKLGGQNIGANANIGSLDAFRFGITTNGTARLYFGSAGRIYTNTVTDVILTPSDSMKISGATVDIASTATAKITSSAQTAAEFIGGLNSNIAATAPNAGGTSGIFMGNSADADNTFRLSRSPDGNLDLAMSNDYPYGADDDSIMTYNPTTGVVNFTVTDVQINGVTMAANGTLTATATLDFPSTNSNEASELTITVTGATDGDPVSLGTPNAVTVTGAIFTAWVSAADTVTVQYYNGSLLGAGNPNSADFSVRVFK